MRSSAKMRRRRLAVRLTAAASVWSLGLLLAALLLPAFHDQTITDANGITLRNATFVQVNGTWVLIPIALPMVVSLAVALAIRQKRLTGARWASSLGWLMIGLLAVLALVSIVSIGAFVIPIVVALALALRLVPDPGGDRPERRARDARAQA